MSQVQAAVVELRRKHLKALKQPTEKRTEKFHSAVIHFKAKYPNWREKVDFIALHGIRSW